MNTQSNTKHNYLQITSINILDNFSIFSSGKPDLSQESAQNRGKKSTQIGKKWRPRWIFFINFSN